MYVYVCYITVLGKNLKEEQQVQKTNKVKSSGEGKVVFLFFLSSFLSLESSRNKKNVIIKKEKTLYNHYQNL